MIKVEKAKKGRKEKEQSINEGLFVDFVMQKGKPMLKIELAKGNRNLVIYKPCQYMKSLRDDLQYKTKMAMRKNYI